MAKKIEVSDKVYEELLELKDKFGVEYVDDAIGILIADYDKVWKQLSMEKLFDANKNENKINLEDLLSDRKKAWKR